MEIGKSGKSEKRGMEKNKIAGILIITVLAILLFSSVLYLPEFGSFTNKDVALYYLRNGLMLTGSANIVNAIVWDFRGYDTMGEETVLFAAAMGVYLIIRRKRYERDS
jgi:multisubunit Na+/H+ antiporter MnhB subunit